MKLAFSLLFIVFVVQCSNNLFLAPNLAGEVQYVTNMDIPRFMGQWYTIANKPNIIETNCHCSRSFDTLLDATTIELAETCWIFGRPTTSKSKAIIQEPNSGNWVNTNFFAKADYWVIELDPNYQWSVIGQPSKKGYWIMSRSKTLDSSIVKALEAKAISQGYDLSNIEYPTQDCD